MYRVVGEVLIKEQNFEPIPKEFDWPNKTRLIPEIEE
jgi:hypothetical protein